MWTEDQFGLEVLKEVAVGNLRELSEEERAAAEINSRIEDRIESGDPDWLEKSLEDLHSQGFEEFGEDQSLIELMNSSM